MKLNDLEIGNLVRFKNEEPGFIAEYYGIVIDKSVISGHFWVRWFNHDHLDFENAEKCNQYNFTGQCSGNWSIIK
jgi:hypothetical protein